MTQIRLTAYLTAFFGGLAVIMSLAGVADYDRATGLLDVHPFNVNWLAAIIAGPLASGMAAVVLWWQGRK
jgi:predicted membrane protein